MTFDEAFLLLIDREKGLSLDKQDPGNWTGGKVGKGVLKGSKYGISAASYPSLDIRNLTLDQAKEIYRKDYWVDIELPGEIVYDFFDTSVNSGKSRAIKILQKAVGVEADGIIGPSTVEAINKTMNLSKKFNAHRLLFMTDCAIWSSQGKGWARRIAHNLLLG